MAVINFKDIAKSNTWKTVKLIDKGWSHDTKYYIETSDDEQLLLKLSDISKYEQKKQEFDFLKKLSDLPILMSRPIEIGRCNDNSNVYVLYTWIDGDEAEDKIPQLSEKEQYELGYQAGKINRMLHDANVGGSDLKWADRFNKKIDRKIEMSRSCSIQFDGSEQIIEYINKNRYLLDSRPQFFQHGDYHIGNMLITKDGQIGVIDFDRYDIGDPWEEFNRITFCADASSYFASGRIDGYFDGDVPDEFFRLLALYIGSNQLGAVTWAIPYGEGEVNTMLRQAENIMRWYDGYKTYIPSWYVTAD